MDVRLSVLTRLRLINQGVKGRHDAVTNGVLIKATLAGPVFLCLE